MGIPSRQPDLYSAMVGAGLLGKRAYSKRPKHVKYVLTDKSQECRR
jgi:DNA-binding HxlR family transcriptional regulator